MLKLYKVSGHRIDHPENPSSFHYILAYNSCHAVQLFYRYYDLNNLLNAVRHTTVEELPVIHPKQINDHEKGL